MPASRYPGLPPGMAGNGEAHIPEHPTLMDMTDVAGGSAGLGGLFLSAFISSTLAPGGSEAVLAYLISQSHGAAAQLVAVATVGNTLGALTTWGLGYWLSRRYPADRPLDARRRAAVLRVRRWGRPLLLLSWLPLVGDGFCFAAGWLRLPLASSTLLIALGKGARYGAIAWAMLA